VPTWNLVDARVVGHQVAALESRATVVTYDPRGAGASERPKTGYDVPLHATDALAVLDATGLELDWQRPARLLGRVTCPTLVVHGEADAHVPVAHAQDIVDEMPNARLTVIPAGGHRPDIRTPELVNPRLLEFLLDQ
jgi:pimeloyl-ACP methyl ester carboxylesterase